MTLSTMGCGTQEMWRQAVHSKIRMSMASALLLLSSAIVLTNPRVSSAETSYDLTVRQAAELRESLATKYESAATDMQRDSLLAVSESALQALLIDSILPRWIGTEWSYNGTTRTPGTGSIACGYLITTVLKDAGFVLPRVKFAQMPSEVMIRRMLRVDEIRRFSHFDIHRFVRDMREWGEGLYIVGLDYHVGFLIVSDSAITFCHSSFFAPIEVVSEDALESPILSQSRYRVSGRLLPNRDIVRAWLTGREFTAE